MNKAALKAVEAMHTRHGHKSHCRWDQYRHWSNKVIIMIRVAKASFYRRVIEENTKNHQQLWSHLRDLYPTTRSPASLVMQNGEREITDTTENLNTPNTYFTTIADRLIPEQQDTERQHTKLREFVRNKLDEDFCIPGISAQSVKKGLASLQTNKSTGPDNISARLLKATTPGIAPPVAAIMNNSIRTGKFPIQWKLAKASPIHKKGPINDKGN